LLKGVEIAPLIAEHHDRLRAAVVIGQQREQVLAALAEFAPDCHVFEIAAEKPEVMSQAVTQANLLAQPGDVVLLAPAAASMDQFKDYEDRGNQFANAVRGLDV
jgi:UDP-N-acetylmuramoylalanine--D-glutamate ligase